MRKLLNLPQFVSLEYKRHDTSLNDNSSFRNTTVWRSGEKGRNLDDGVVPSPTNAGSATQSRNNASRDGAGSSRNNNDRNFSRSFNRGREGNNARSSNSANWTRDSTPREKKVDRSGATPRAEDEDAWSTTHP